MGLLSAGASAGIGQQLIGIATDSQNQQYAMDKLAAQEEMAKRLEEYREQSRRSGAEYDAKNIDPIRSANRVNEAGLVKQKEIELTLANANKLADIEIAKLERLEPIKAKIAANAKLAELTTLSSPEALAAARKIAAASHSYAPGAMAEAELKKMQLDSAKLLNDMQGKYANAIQSGDKVAAQGIADVMIARFTTPSNKQDSATVTAALKVYADPMADEAAHEKAGMVLSRAFDKELGGAVQGGKGGSGIDPTQFLRGKDKVSKADAPAPLQAGQVISGLSQDQARLMRIAQKEKDELRQKENEARARELQNEEYRNASNFLE